MRNAYLEQLYQLAKDDKRILALISDNGAIVYDQYRGSFPEQYINYGISEANMLASAAGLASCGKIPFAYTIGSFLAYRAYEFIRNDICLQNQNVKIVGIGAGMVYSTLGPTHHCTEDLSVLRVLPNLTIFSPASPLEVKKVTKAAAEITGPVYIRLGTKGESEIYSIEYDFCAGKGVVLKEGKDLTFITTGAITSDVIEVVGELEREKKVSLQIINIHTIKPLDKELIIQAANQTGKIITVEEHNITGGLGSAVAEVLSTHNLNVQFDRVGLNDCFAKGYGNHQQVKEMNGIGQQMIKGKVNQMLGRG